MRILGIDPGTGILGFGIIEVEGRKISLVDGGIIKTPAKQADHLRLSTIYDELSGVVAEHKPKVMAIEKLFFTKNITTAMSVAQAKGVVMLCGQQQGLQIHEYTPLQIKQALTGYGRAEKSQIQEMVRITLGLKEIPKPDDCADALACAITHAQSV